jgi:galactose mutarotase-like enzyme
MITLGNRQIALTLEPAFGARVTSLTDLASGRQWLVPGDCADGDAYLGDQARGWDECFPTVGVCRHHGWGGLMRDHGELWAREWLVTHDANTCMATYDDPRFTFGRSLNLQGASVIADYQVTNRSPKTLPYLWSQHALLATTPADHISLQGITDMRVNGQPVDWPNHPERDLSVVGLADEGFALKLYGHAENPASASVTGPDGGIRFDWSGTDIPAFGLWLDYGGWPPGRPVHQVALEPATAPADDLVQAEATGRSIYLAPAETHRWSVRITLTPPSEPPRPN